MTDLETLRTEVESEARWNNIRKIGLVFLLLAIVAGMILLSVLSYYRGQAVEDLGHALNKQREQVIYCADKGTNDPNCQEPVAPPADKVIEDKGDLVPSVGPAGPIGPEGPEGPEGPPPTTAQVQSAVNNYCSGGRCDGRGPTASQVAAAVSLYCNSRGECRGKQGDEGDQGDRGIPGVQGQKGDNATPEMVASAVSAYCSNQPGGTCKGERGAAGADGKDGKDGAQGKPGTSAVPFTFVFTVPGSNPVDPSRTYRCVVTAPDTEVVCTEVTQQEGE